MKFTFETQGAITYLVCELDAVEQLDSLTLGMLTNNHITGLAPVLYTEMDGRRFLKYNISAKVSADQFFGGNMNKQRTLQAFQNILNALCSADEYMIEQNCFSVVPEHIFLNVSSCEIAMICIPVVLEKDINAEIAEFFKKILFSAHFDPTEDASFITQLISYINNAATFNVYGLKDLVDGLQNGTIVAQPVAPQPVSAAPAPQAAPQPVAPPVVQPAPAQPAVPPMPSFDSTISIDDMPAMMAQKKAEPSVQKAPQPPIQNIPTPPPARPNPQPAPPPMPQSVPQPPKPAIPPVAKPMNNTPPMNKPQQPPMAVPKPPVAAPKPPVSNGPGFAIPGQPAVSAKPQTPPMQAQKPAKETGEKKMSFFGLLANYNKENAELYKKQKAEAKQAKSPAAPMANPQAPMGNVPGRAPMGQPPVNAAPAAQPTVPPRPAYQAPVQPIPVQNSFSETTVLSPMMNNGETTVLSAAPGVADPHLVRLKTGERVSINKPVFRIGKEKSYVDYFIADNTAISRSHANIHTDNGEYFIEDTNSTNHTYVNGKLINSNVKTKLASGDKIRLANEDFTFSI